MLVKTYQRNTKNENTSILIYTKIGFRSFVVLVCFIIWTISTITFWNQMGSLRVIVVTVSIIYLSYSVFDLFSNERIIVTSDQLVINKRVLNIRYWSKTYELQFVRNMYVKKNKRLEILSHREYNPKYDYSYYVSFDYLKERQDFAKGIERVEGKELVGTFFKHYSLKE